MPFTGFNLQYPEYEVTTPHTNLKFNVRSLNVSEEERMKGSFLSPQKITEHLNKIIFESLAEKPKHIKVYEDFKQALTIKDRDALLFGLYHISYEEIRNYDITCSSCQHKYPITTKASDTLSTNAYPEDNILSKVVEVELPLSKGVKAFIKQPSLAEEAETLQRQAVLSPNIELLTQAMVITKFEQDVPNAKEPDVYDDRSDIVSAFQTLPARDKRAINDAYIKEFGQYQIELKINVGCPSCGNNEVVNIDLVENFFRMVYGL